MTEDELKREAERLGLGATGKYPLGAADPTDKGELRAAIHVDSQTKRIFVNFGKPIAWLAMNAFEARQFAACLIDKVKELEALQK